MDVPLVLGVLPEASRVEVTHEPDSSATCPVSQTVLLPQWPVGACMLDFHSRRHLLDHLAHVSPPCLMAMVFDSNGEVPAHLEDPDFEEVFPPRELLFGSLSAEPSECPPFVLLVPAPRLPPVLRCPSGWSSHCRESSRIDAAERSLSR